MVPPASTTISTLTGDVRLTELIALRRRLAVVQSAADALVLAAEDATADMRPSVLRERLVEAVRVMREAGR